MLGPILFLIHINDICRVLNHSKESSFADDTRVLMPVNDSEDCGKLQDDLDNIYQWAVTNNMSFNNSKFGLLRYSAGAPVEFTYCAADGAHITESASVTDLGIIMSSETRFKEQIAKTTKSARNQAGWIMRVFSTRDRDPMLTLYRALVLPLLEYCCQPWNPSAVGLVHCKKIW